MMDIPFVYRYFHCRYYISPSTSALLTLKKEAQFAYCQPLFNNMAGTLSCVEFIEFIGHDVSF
jgi:hypothetical protein